MRAAACDAPILPQLDLLDNAPRQSQGTQAGGNSPTPVTAGHVPSPVPTWVGTRGKRAPCPPKPIHCPPATGIPLGWTESLRETQYLAQDECRLPPPRSTVAHHPTHSCTSLLLASGLSVPYQTLGRIAYPASTSALSVQARILLSPLLRTSAPCPLLSAMGGVIMPSDLMRGWKCSALDVATTTE